MRTMIRPALVLLAIFTLLTGVLYPLAVTGAAQALFPAQANGSLVRDHDRATRERGVATNGGRVAGSSLIGQAFDDPRYFWGRPSATAPSAYNAASSNASNLGPSSPALADAVKARVEALRAAHPDMAASPVPIDLVTTSASGLDPHISLEAAMFQAGRVARARGLSEERVRALVKRYGEGRTLGLLGEPRVNVLALNLALDQS